MRNRWEQIRNVVFGMSVMLTVAALLAVSFLTSQSGAATLSTQEKFVMLFPFAFRQHYRNRIWLHLELNSARRLAHIYEFGFFGLSASMMMLTAPWPRRQTNHLSSVHVGRRLAATVLLCAAVSVLDQVHKIFVEYRHFDLLDLRLDAIGYVGASLVVTFLYYLATRHLLKRAGAALEQNAEPAGTEIYSSF